MKNRRRMIGIVAATLLALVGTISLVGYVRSAKNEVVAREALVDVYVVDEHVPKGADADTIRASVSIEQIPARLTRDDRITDLDDVGDQVAASDLEAGDQLVGARLAAGDQVAQEITDKVQVSALLEAQRAVGGALEKGDLVGVYLSFDPFDVDTTDLTITFGDDTADEVESDLEVAIANAAGEPDTDADENDPSTLEVNVEENTSDGDTKKTPNVSRLEFQHVLVTNVQTINPPVTNPETDEPSDAGIAQVSGTQYVVTLALSPEQSERFVFATEFGHVWLSLDPATVEDDGTRAVTLQDVFTVVEP